jgi:hypothetical protein
VTVTAGALLGIAITSRNAAIAPALVPARIVPQSTSRSRCSFFGTATS